MFMIPWWEMGLRLLLAAVLGAVIGINRERHEWAAGLRTHMLVCVGSTLTILVSMFGFFDVIDHPNIRHDPARLAAQVISGIGFLGAGTILFMQREQVIRGLTTAAGLWAIAAVGLAVGAGLYLAAIMATLLLWCILALLKPFERRYRRRRIRDRAISLHLQPGTPLSSIEHALAEVGLTVASMGLYRTDDDLDRVNIEFDPPLAHTELSGKLERLRQIDGMVSIEITVSKFVD